MGKRFTLTIVSILSAIIGVYLMYESFVLQSQFQSIDGTGVGFHPFGLDLLIPTEKITPTSIKTFIFGFLFVVVSLLLIKLKELQKN